MEVYEDAAAAGEGMSSSATNGAAASCRRKLRLAMREQERPPPSPLQTRWRNSAQEKIYSRRLLEALRSTAAAASTARLRPSASTQAVKEAADSALALTAQGRTRWSRAILKRRWRMRKRVLLLKKAAGGKARASKDGRRGSPTAAGEQSRCRWGTAGPMKGKNIRVRERLRVLSRLVPGCRKASTPTLLEEAADYMAALELQVKAMRALADALSSAASSAAAAPPDHI